MKNKETYTNETSNTHTYNKRTRYHIQDNRKVIFHKQINGDLQWFSIVNQQERRNSHYIAT